MFKKVYLRKKLPANQLFFFLVLLFTFFSKYGFAQNHIVLIHQVTADTVRIYEGDVVTLSYRGYLGQKTYSSGKVLDIDEHSITVKDKYHRTVPKTFSKNHSIQIKDISGFRKFRKSRLWLLPTLKAVNTIANLGLSIVLGNNNDISTTKSILIGTGVGLTGNILIESLFPKKVKQYINKQDWKIFIQKPIREKVL